MTQEQLQYWGHPVVATTVYESIDGVLPILGWVESNGTFHPTAPSNVNKTVVCNGTEFVVVWHGGTLLPEGAGNDYYKDSTRVAKDHSILQTTTKTRARKCKPRAAKGNRTKGLSANKAKG